MLSFRLEELKEQQLILIREMERSVKETGKDASPEFAALTLISSLLITLIEALVERQRDCPVGKTKGAADGEG
jgi:hypothetical protein